MANPLQWDRKAWSREHFFASVGLPLDPGNAVLCAALMALVVLSGAICTHFPGKGDAPCPLCVAAGSSRAVCARCLLVPQAESASSGQECLPHLLRYLLVAMQHQMPHLRMGLAKVRIDREEAGDILESVGGLMRPWAKRAECVFGCLAQRYRMRASEVKDALRCLTNFVQAASFAFAHANGDLDQYKSLLEAQFPQLFSVVRTPMRGSVAKEQPCSLCSARAPAEAFAGASLRSYLLHMFDNILLGVFMISVRRC